MPVVPVIIAATYVLASHWNYIEWTPLDPNAQMTIQRTPPLPASSPGAMGPNYFFDEYTTAGVTYKYSVCATLEGDKQCSEPVTLPPSQASDPKAPPAPQIVSHISDFKSIQIVWRANQTMSKFLVIWGRDGAPEEPQVDINSAGTDGSWRTPDSLPEGTMYHFRVKGLGEGLYTWSNWSSDYHFRTAQHPPPTPTISADVTSNGVTGHVKWTGVPGATSASLVRYRKDNPVPEATFDGLHASGELFDPNLAPFTTYGYAIVSKGAGIDAASSTVYVTTYYNSTVSHPFNFGALPFTPLSTASWGSDRIDLVYAGAGHDIERQAWDVSQWLPGNTNWQWLGDWTTGTPLVVPTPPLGSEVFVRGKDNNVYAKSVAGGYAPQDWEPLGGTASATPTAVTSSPGRLDVFIVGSDNQIYQKTRSNGSWLPSQTGWIPLGGYSNYSPVAISSAPGRIDLFISGVDQSVYQKTWDGTHWLPSVGGWSKVGGTILGPPAAISWGSGRIDLVVVGTDSNVYQKTWEAGRWWPSDTGWESLGGKTMTTPTLASWGPGRLDLVIIGTDHGVYHKAWNGSQWAPSQATWEAVGGTVYGDPLNISTPTAVTWGLGRLDLFVMGTDKAIYQKTLIWDHWAPANGWVAHGGQVQAGN